MSQRRHDHDAGKAHYTEHAAKPVQKKLLGDLVLPAHWDDIHRIQPHKIGVFNMGVLGDVLNTAVLPCNKQ